MSPLPPELLDSILDHLHDKPATLKMCCIVSKSWIPHARRHLFAHVSLYDLGSSIELWKKTFPDPSDSPAHHTRTLSIIGSLVITAADMGVGGWIRTFHNVVHLELSYVGRTTPSALYGLSPTLRSLSLRYTPFDFRLIYSFPLLEDLALVAAPSFTDVNRWNTTLRPPKLTGTLILEACGEARFAIRQLFDLSGGLHFSEIRTTFCNEEAEPVSDLVSTCSKPLKKLTLSYRTSVFPSTPVASQNLTIGRSWRHDDAPT